MCTNLRRDKLWSVGAVGNIGEEVVRREEKRFLSKPTGGELGFVRWERAGRRT